MRNIIALLIVIILIWIYTQQSTTSNPESMVNLIYKQVPQKQFADYNSIKIDAIPMYEKVDQQFAEDLPIRAIQADKKPHIALTFDASVARNALMRSRDKRVFDAIANRTANYWRPFFEEEINQCEYRDWWDDVAIL